MFKDIKYFNGLNALRFFAAYLVVIHHAEKIRKKYGLFNLDEYSIFNHGSLAVTFFFALSGFLITYLLLKERNKTQDISVKNFYMRRVLRIWPLYFFLVLIGTVLIPFLLNFINTSYEMPYTFGEVILYYIFFAPFMVNVIYGMHLLSPLWSIGVEELFYLIWAPLFKFFKKHILGIMLVILFVKILVSIWTFEMVDSVMVQRVVVKLQFDIMALGGITAYIIFNAKENIINGVLFSKTFQVLMFLLLGIRLFVMYTVNDYLLFEILFRTPVFSNLLMGLVFCWLIVNVSLNDRSLIKLDVKWLNYLGEISYGIYMYHMLIIFGVILVFSKQLNSLNNTLSTVVFYVVITGLTIIVSGLSKKYFEDRFNRLKKKFQSPLKTNE